METTKILQELIGKKYSEIIKNISIEEDQGDCCGWSEVHIDDKLVSLDGKENAILVDCVKISYGDDDDTDCTVVNFVFDIGNGEGLILGYDLQAGSGSGWHYGAYCTLNYEGKEVATASF